MSHATHPGKHCKFSAQRKLAALSVMEETLLVVMTNPVTPVLFICLTNQPVPLLIAG